MSTVTAPTPSGPAPSGPLTPAPGSTHTEPFHYEDTSGAPRPNEAFDKMFPSGEGEPKEAPKAPAPAPEPAKAAPEAPKPAPTKFSVDEGLPKEPEAKPPEPPKAPAPEPKTNKELREAYQRSQEEMKARDAELTQLRQKLAEPKPQTNGDAAQYEAKLKELQERLSEYETEIKFADYSRSAEYREQYQQPLELAVKTANDDLASFTVTTADGSERPAGFADLRPLLMLQPGAAWKQAREIFGDAAPAIMRYRDQIVGLNQKAQGALDEYRTKGAERMKQQEQEMTMAETRQAEERVKAFDTHIGSRVASVPALYGPDAADPEGNKLLDAGRKLVDIAFKGDESVDDGDLVRIQAEVAARAVGFGRMVYRNKVLEGKVAELTKELSQYKKSEPAKGSKDAGAPEPTDERRSWERALDAIPALR